MSSPNHLKPPLGPVFNRAGLVFLSLLLLALIGSACSTPDTRPVPVLSPLPFHNPAGDAPLRAPSAMEAMSRGIAAVTPPGAALQDVYYEFDSIDLATDAQAILKQNADWMKNNPKSRVEVEGHCDDLGSNEYNLALGAKRAQSAKEFLVNQGIAPERLVTISYGKEAPACFEPTDECRVKNRRARFVIFTELPTS
jgi:peptidoglycan-associated lipoprotein